MKNLFLLALLTLALPAAAYEAVSSNKASFGVSTQAAPAEQQTASGTNPAVPQTRTFSTYQSRQQNWSKGVQTQTVQTSVAGQNFQEPDVTSALKTKVSKGGKTAGKSDSGASSAAKKAPSPKEGTAAKPNASTLRSGSAVQPPTADENPMENMQKMMSGNPEIMKALSNSGALPTGGGMPDLSKLLGGRQPKK